jgi:hypothetical protein
MYEMPVSGSIRAIACKEGSSGIFVGDLNGLYQGYRFASTTPYDQTFDLALPNGTVSLRVRQEIVTPLPTRPAEHPFAGGQDPFEDKGAYLAKAFAGRGGPPPGLGGHGPPAGTTGGGEGGAPPFNPFKKVHYVATRFEVDPDKSTGIFAGATGEVELDTPRYKMAGHLVINTDEGDLRLDFLESSVQGVLTADLTVDGELSTGIYEKAEGKLTFKLTVQPPVFGEGPYEGTIYLQKPPSG